MIKYFSSNQPFVIVLIPIMVLGHLLLDAFFPSFELLAIGQENLWGLDFTLIDALTSRIGAFFAVCINAILINWFFNTHEFYDRNNYLPSLVYVLLVFLFPLSLRLGEDLIAHTFFILSLSKLYDIKQNDDARANTFLSGLFLGGAITFLPIYIYFLIFIWFCTLSIRPFVSREFVLPIIGVALPLGWVAFIDPNFYENFILFTSFLEYSHYGIITLLIPHIIVALLSIIAYKHILDRRSKSSIRYKRIIGLTSYVFLFSILVSIAVVLINGSYFYFTIGAVILSIIIPYSYLDSRHKWIPSILLYVLLLINIAKFFY
ncbi:MAG: hypothetical protein WED10_15430 [Brumimicrobium sp.]